MQQATAALEQVGYETEIVLDEEHSTFSIAVQRARGNGRIVIDWELATTSNSRKPFSFMVSSRT